MKDEAWKSLFDIREREPEKSPDGDEWALAFGSSTYDVVNIHSGEIVGNYRDRHYAKKQAKRKYKKLMKLMEKKFMSVEEVEAN